jgi:hypothetical protein
VRHVNIWLFVIIVTLIVVTLVVVMLVESVTKVSRII